MILTETHRINLRKSYDKIFHLYPAFRNTFVFLAHRGIGIDLFVHCDAQGKVLY